MLLGVLQGYDIETCEYKVDGQIQPRPKDPFCVVLNTLPADYNDISDHPEYWDKYGSLYIGTLPGFKDWMCLRAIILPLITTICGVDYSNWNALTSAQKQTALKFFPTKIIAAKGFTFFATESGSVENAYEIIDFYLKTAEQARELRYTNYVNFGYQYLGALQGLKAESYLRELFLDATYIKRGVLYVAVDGIDGLANWTISDNGFSTNGLKARIENGEFTLGGGISLNTFINTLIGIVDDGAY